MKKRTKYGNRVQVIDGVRFDSLAEKQRYDQLLWLEKSGHIRNLKRQVRFPLTAHGVKICTYIADHTYEENAYGVWEAVIEDVKSKITLKNPVYIIKKKMMAAQYGIRIREWLK